MFAGSLQGVTQTLPLAIYSAVRARLRHGARDGRAARGRQRRAAARPQAGAHVATLSADFELPLRSFELRLALEVERDGRARRAVRRGQELGAARDRRARAADAGRIALDGEVWLDAETSASPPEERRVGLVFQEYALFPHLSVGGTSPSAARSASPSCSSASASRTSRTHGRASSRAASGSASRWRARSRATPACCCSTSRSRRSTRTRRTTVRLELQELLQAFELPTLIVTHDYEDAAALAGTRRRARRGRAAPARLAGRARLAAERPVRRLVHRREPAARPRAVARRRAHARAARERRDRLLDRHRAGRGRRGRLPVGRLDRPHPRGRLGAEPGPRRDRLGLAASATACACGSAR